VSRSVMIDATELVRTVFLGCLPWSSRMSRGIDDFALRRGLVYATVLIDAETGRRVDLPQGRTADVAGDWLREHPGVEIVCRDGFAPASLEAAMSANCSLVTRFQRIIIEFFKLFGRHVTAV
jgi:transposase